MSRTQNLPASPTAPTPPEAKRIAHERTHHGHTFVDHYEWMRDKESPAVIAHLEAENAYTEHRTNHLAGLREDIFNEIRTRVKETDLSVPVRRGKWWYFSRTTEGKDYATRCRVPVAGPDDWTPPAIDGEGRLPDEQVVLDSNVEAEGHEFFALGSFSLSPDGTRLAWAADTSGEERYTLRVRDLQTGEDLADEIPNTFAGACFDVSGDYVFYTTVDEAWRPDKVWRHRIGTEVTEDECVFSEEDDRYFVGVGVSRSERYIFFVTASKITTAYWFIDALDPTGTPQVVWRRVEGVEYSVDHAIVSGEDRFVIVHNRNRPDFEISDVPVSDPESEGREVLPDVAGRRIEDVDAFRGRLVVSYREGGFARVGVIGVSDEVPEELSLNSIHADGMTGGMHHGTGDLVAEGRYGAPVPTGVVPEAPAGGGAGARGRGAEARGGGGADAPAGIVPEEDLAGVDPVGGAAEADLTAEAERSKIEGRVRTGFPRNPFSALTEVTADEPIGTMGLAGNPEWEQPRIRMVYTSMVTPTEVFDYDLDTGERTLLKRQPVLGGVDVSAYEQDLVWATAEDGTRIPVSLVWRTDAVPAGTPAPTLLYGYGSYEASMDPYFSVARLSLLDRGVVWAVAHVRGGGEMGRHWYEEGKTLHKVNTFTDFVAVADHLIAEGRTAREKLVAMGGSAGGLLMGAVANLAPDRFAGISANVPFVDALTSILMPELPLTVIEWDEWGDPLHDPEVYRYMRQYSPYENVREQDYPRILAITSLNDTRVLYVEPAKWVARLREVGADALLKTEMSAGHGGASGRYDSWRETAFEFAWILDVLGLAEVMTEV
ncbi:hypothetical protein GCM10022261_08040 [Brevibacterium daeguense]|uniref:Oligopeptidase B n=1 Tax=Brevibacterium daeguense TaxID=909936 RepID=A0ABP8EH29_9MICO|nr:S9 family peptidase [Brevibacterium daeguense]